MMSMCAAPNWMCVLVRIAVCAVVPLSLLLCLSQSAIGDFVEYRQVFGDDGSDTTYNSVGNMPMPHVGWYAHQGAGATPFVGGTAGIFISAWPGKPGNLPNVNTGAVAESENLGYGAKTTSGIGMAWTDQWEIDRAGREITSFSFYSRDDNSADTYRVAIRIGETEAEWAWFASEMTFSNAGGGSAMANAIQHTLPFLTDGAAWRDLTFIPDSQLSLAATSRSDPLPDGNVTAFGLYMDLAAARTMRFDTFEIAVPEPGTLLLLTVGLAAFVLVRRRGNR